MKNTCHLEGVGSAIQWFALVAAIWGDVNLNRFRTNMVDISCTYLGEDSCPPWPCEVLRIRNIAILLAGTLFRLV